MPSATADGPHVVAVLNPKGGSGKTTLAVHVARAWHLGGVGVVVVDTDAQGTASAWRESSPAGYDGPVVVPVASAAELRQAMRRADADVVVVDGSARLEGFTGACVAVADVVVVPVTPSALDLPPALDVVALCRRAGTPAVAVVSAAVARSRLARQVREALTAEGVEALPTQTGHRVAYAEAMARGVTVLDTAPGLRPDPKAAAEVRALASAVASFLSTHT
jgi:chromosome partitioning protein